MSRTHLFKIRKLYETNAEYSNISHRDVKKAALLRPGWRQALNAIVKMAAETSSSCSRLRACLVMRMIR